MLGIRCDPVIESQILIHIHTSQSCMGNRLPNIPNPFEFFFLKKTFETWSFQVA